MSREALVLLVCCCDFRDRAERLIPSKSLRNAVIWAFPGLLCILRMCAPRRAAAVVRPRGREKSADRRRRILISRLLIIRASVPRWKSPFPAYFKGFPAVSPLIPPYPAFLKYPVSPHLRFHLLGALLERIPFAGGVAGAERDRKAADAVWTVLAFIGTAQQRVVIFRAVIDALKRSVAAGKATPERAFPRDQKAAWSFPCKLQ